MSGEEVTRAEVAMLKTADGRILLVAEVAGERIERECSSEHNASLRAAGLVEAALRAAGLGMRDGTLDAVLVTVKARSRELSTEELDRLLARVR